MSPEERTLIDGFIAELSAVLNAMLGLPVSSKPGAVDASPGWVVRVSITGQRTGMFSVGFTRAQAGRLSARVMMMDSDPSDAEIADTIKELVAQAIGGLSLKPEAQGMTLRVEADVAVGAELIAGVTPIGFDLPVDADLTVKVACAMASTAEAAAVQPGASAVAGGDESKGAVSLPENLEVILDIDLPLSVRFGHAELTLDALTKLGPGSLIELARLPDDPVELLVNGKLIARGEVVVVGGNYGVRVHEVVSAAERIRTLE
jgi:flagellar motor switch protein FliN